MKKKILVFLTLLILCGAAAGLGYWAYRQYGEVIPELPEWQNYEDLETRAVEAQKVAHRRGLSEDYCLFVDYSIPSGTPRLFVWSFQENKAVASTYVMHGPGLGSTAEEPVFSNAPGSKCSSLGEFAVTKNHGAKLKRSFRLRGLELANRTAWGRGLMIHRSTWVDRHCGKKHIPLHEKSCSGCVTVSSPGMAYLEKLINRQSKQLLLWSYNQ